MTIQIASRLSGVSIDLIRAWERRYKAVSPARDKDGRRLYERHEVQKLWYLRELTQLGVRISDIARLSEKDLKKRYTELTGKKGVGLGPDQNQTIATSLKQNIERAIEGYRLDILSHEVKKASISLNKKQFALEVIAPVMGLTGKLVSEGRLSIAQEHAISSLAKFHIGALLSQITYKNQGSVRNIIFATPKKDFHEFGILVSALISLHYGHNVIYLGPNLPVFSLVEAVKALEADTVVIGQSNRRRQTTTTNYINECLNSLPKKVTFCYGGVTLENLPLKLSLKKNLKIFKTFKDFDLYISK